MATRHGRRRLWRWLAALAIGAAPLLLAGFIVLQTAWFHDWLRRTLIDRTRSALDGQLAIGSITGDVLRELTLHDVVLMQEGRPIAQIPTVSVRYGIVGIIRGQFAIDYIRADRPVVHFDPAVDRSPFVVVTSNQPAQTVVIKRFVIESGVLALGNRQRPDRQFSAITTDGAATIGTATTVTIDDLAARDDRTGVVVRHFTSSMDLKGSDVTVDRFHLATASSDVTGRAIIRGSAGDADIELHAAPVALRELGAYVLVTIDKTLTPHVDAHATGTLRALHLVASMTSEAGSVRADVVADVASATKTATGTASVANLDPARWTGRRDLAGQVTAQGAFDISAPQASIDRAVVRFDISAPAATVGRYRASHVKATGIYRVSTTTGHVVADTFDAHWDVQGSFTPAPAHGGRMRYAAAGRVQGLHPTRLGEDLGLPALADPRLAGTVNARFDVRGEARSLDDQSTSGTVDVTNSTIAGAQIASLHLSASSANHQVTADVDAELAGVTSRAVGVNAFSATTAGTIHAHVMVPDVTRRPDVDEIDADVNASLGSSDIGGLAVDHATVDASLHGGLASVRQFDVAAPAGTLSAAGTLALCEGAESRLSYTATIADLEPFSDLAGRRVRGEAHVTGTLAGPLQATRVAGKVAVQQVHVDPDTSILSADLNVSGVVSNWQFAEATGTVNGEGAFISASGVDIEHLTLDVAANEGAFDIKTTLDRQRQSIVLNAIVAPHPDWREIEVRQMTFGTPGKLWTSSSPDILIHDTGADISINNTTFVQGAQQITISGHAATARGASSDLTVDIAHVQVADLNAIDRGQHAITGVLDGSAHLTGSLSAPNLAAHAEVTGGSVDKVTFDRATADLGYNGTVATVDAELIQSGTNRLTVKGAVPKDAKATGIDLKVQSSSLDVRLLQPFLSSATLTGGLLEAAATITGSRTAPDIQGRIAVSNTAFTLPATGIKYQNLNASAHFNGEDAVIDTLTVEDDDKHVLKAEGGLKGWLQDARAIDITLSTQGFHVLRNKLGQAGVDATLKIGGSLDHPDVSGEVSVANARLSVDEWMAQFASNAAPVEETPATPVSPDRSTWNVTLVAPNNVIVQGQPASGAAGPVSLGSVNAMLGGRLTITKEAGGSPKLNGRLAVIRGTYTFQNRPFAIARDSSAVFRGRDPIDPDISLTAERQSGGATVDVHVTGTASAPTVSLSSDPPLDEGDILALILFDEPVNSLGQSERVTLTDRATSIAESALSGPLASALARTLDVDLVEIRPASDTSAAPSVAIGQHIGSNLYVRVQQNVSDAQDSQLSLEYQISKTLRLATTVAQNAPQSTISRRTERSGVDLIFVIRYR